MGILMCVLSNMYSFDYDYSISADGNYILIK